MLYLLGILPFLNVFSLSKVGVDKVKIKFGYLHFIHALSIDRFTHNFGMDKVKTNPGYPGFIHALSAHNECDLKVALVGAAFLYVKTLVHHLSYVLIVRLKVDVLIDVVLHLSCNQLCTQQQKIK